MSRQLVVILGMHRSGTSLITKCIELLGYSLGDNLMPPGVDNPTGFWEDLDIVQFNDKLLGNNQTSWESPVGSRSAEYPKKLQREALRLLKSKFSNTERFVVKDPRMSLLLDFWSERFVEADIPVEYLVVYRQPLEIAASLHARNGMEREHGLLLTYVYNRALMTFLGDNVFLVGYRQFLENPLGELSRIAVRIGGEFDKEEAGSFIENFVNPDLKHHGFTEEDFAGHELAFPEMVDLAAMMSRIAGGSIEPFDSHMTKYPDPRSSVALSLCEYQIKADFKTKEVLRAKIEEKDQGSTLLQGALTRQKAALKDVRGRLRERDAHVGLLTADVSGLVADVARSNEALKERDELLEERDAHVGLLTADVSGLVADVARSNEALKERDDLLKERAFELNQWSKEFSSLSDDRDTAINARDTTIHELDTTIHEIRYKTRLLLEQNEDLKRQIGGYQQHLEAFNRIHLDVLGSVSFRLGRALTYPVRKPLTAWLLPRLKGNNGGLAVVKFVRTCVARPLAALKMMSPRRIKNFYLLLTDRQNLAEQVVQNYQLEMEKEVPVPDVDIYHHSGQELSEINLSFPHCENPLVSVLIPVYNQIDYTLKCLASIKQHLPAVTIEIVVADDCSTDSTPEVLARLEGIKVVRHKENLGFLRSCNSC